MYLGHEGFWLGAWEDNRGDSRGWTSSGEGLGTASGDMEEVLGGEEDKTSWLRVWLCA